jgi:hypothetical protein
MTALIIILSIILFFLILLLCPVTVYAYFEDELTAKVRYLFITYKIHQKPEEEKRKLADGTEEIEKKVKTNETKSRIKDIIEQKGLSGFLNIIKDFASIATETAKKLFSHMIINNISTDIAVADEDAAQTAILYGYVCTLVYTSIGLLVNNMKCRNYHINIVPDFQSKESRIRFEAKAHIQLLFLVSSGLSALLRSLKVLKAAKITLITQRNQKIKE